MNKTKNLTVEAVVCPACQTVYPLVHTPFLANVRSLQWIIGLVQGLWLLLRYQYWNLTGTPLRYPVAAFLQPSCSIGSVGPVPSHVPTVYRWGGCWGGLPHSPGSGPRWYLGWSACRLSLFLITRVSSPNTPVSKGQSQFCSHTHRPPR